MAAGDQLLLQTGGNNLLLQTGGDILLLQAAAETSLWIPDPRWEEPNLLIPGKKPTGPVVVGNDSAYAKNLVIFQDGYDAVATQSGVTEGKLGQGTYYLAQTGIKNGERYSFVPVNSIAGGNYHPVKANARLISGLKNITIIGRLIKPVSGDNNGVLFSCGGGPSPFQLNFGADLYFTIQSDGSWADHLQGYCTTGAPAGGFFDFVLIWQGGTNTFSMYVNGESKSVTYTSTGSPASAKIASDWFIYPNITGLTWVNYNVGFSYFGIWEEAMPIEKALNFSRNPYCFLIPA